MSEQPVERPEYVPLTRDAVIRAGSEAIYRRWGETYPRRDEISAVVVEAVMPMIRNDQAALTGLEMMRAMVNPFAEAVKEISDALPPTTEESSNDDNG